jgi:hypothetical protein
VGPATCVGGAHANAEYDGNADRTCEKDPGKSFHFLGCQLLGVQMQL